MHIHKSTLFTPSPQTSYKIGLSCFMQTPSKGINTEMETAANSNSKVRGETHGERRVTRRCDRLQVQAYSYHQPSYTLQCPSGCAGQRKILTVLLLAGWNEYTEHQSFIWDYIYRHRNTNDHCT